MPVLGQKKREEVALLRLLSFSIKDPQRLFNMTNTLTDPVLLTIAENPRFCLNSAQQLRLIDIDTLAGMQASNQDNRALIDTIDNSGPTGIGYIMSVLPENAEGDAK